MIKRRTITSRSEWLEWRKADVTASAIGALFGCHPYITALRLYAEKRGTEFLVEDNIAMRRGRWMEPAVGKAVMERRPDWRLIPATEYYRDSELRLGATPDFHVLCEGLPRKIGVCQAKTVAPSVYAREWADGTEVPLWIVLQATVEAMLTDAAFIVVAALVVDPHNMDVVIFELERNGAAEEKIRAAVAAFWYNVEHGIEPDPDFGKDEDVVRAMWRRETVPEITIDLSGDNELPSLLAERVVLKEGIKTAEARVGEIDTRLRHQMRDASVAVGIDGFRISNRTRTYKSYTVPASERRILQIIDQRSK